MGERDQYPSNTASPCSELVAHLLQERSIPFAELIAPHLVLTVERIREKFKRRYRAELESFFPNLNLLRSSLSLGRDLSQVLSSTFYNIYRERRPRRMNLTPILFDGNQYYQSFVSDQETSRLYWFEEDAPIAARISRVIESTYTDNVLLLLNRIHKDRAILQRCFDTAETIETELTLIESGLSDRHDGGKSVCRLHLGDQFSIVYKPRSVRAEDLFFKVIDCLSAHGIEPVPRTLKLICRDGYGWSEYVEPRLLTSQNGAARFYFRCGAALSISEALAITDLHNDNVIADGEHLLLFDTETIGHPEPYSESGWPENGPVERGFAANLFKTGLLPYWKEFRSSESGTTLNPSGLTAPTDSSWRSHGVTWRNLSKDGIYFERKLSRTADVRNLPKSTDSTFYRPEDYVAAICAGYEATSSVLRANRSEILTLVDSTLEGESTRFIFGSSHECMHGLG